ncbi:uncharacterized protein N7529_011504 [Penicillium soppii]|jgi:hypothetical protein|uniref:uncharacterized protein n=1 Tax=Penicillium soppii TaxID=69789 RepID=UPI0025485DF1|nr:uncharacterized protein N7529_011504 [Penicillium soppii]KAJ5852119.1 hypothetical protein N7529_011504 [Penicillium soppii]
MELKTLFEKDIRIVQDLFALPVLLHVDDRMVNYDHLIPGQHSWSVLSVGLSYSLSLALVWMQPVLNSLKDCSWLCLVIFSGTEGMPEQ